MSQLSIVEFNFMFSFKTFVPVLVILLFSVTLKAQPGANDFTFGPGGYGIYGIGHAGYTINVQNDGKIIIGGRFNAYDGISRRKIARLNMNGSVDTSFDPGLGFGTSSSEIIYASAIQNDGKIIIGGNFTRYNNNIKYAGLARLNPDGSQDTTFKLITGVKGYSFNTSVRTISLQSDGKIIIGGYFSSYNGTTRNSLARINSDGSLDTTFNVVLPSNVNVFSSAIQSNGKIVIAGNFTSINGITLNRIARLNVDGSLDATFDPGTGIGVGSANSICINKYDGKITIGGRFDSYNGIVRYNLARLNSDGSLDNSFDSGSIIGTANSTVYACALQNDGKVVIGGNFNSNVTRYFTRLNEDGSIDSTFNQYSKTITNYIHSICLQGDGKILIGGLFITYNGSGKIGLARVLVGCESVSGPSFSPTVCINTLMPNITHVTDAVGIGTTTSLPPGVTATWANNTLTISGTPTSSGIFNYSIPILGGCGTVNASGTIIVNPVNTVSSASSTPTLCINTPLPTITHNTSGATGIGSAQGLPTGITATWANNTLTISGTPTSKGTFNYSVPLIGGCGTVTAIGTIVVKGSSSLTLNKSTCNSFSFRGQTYTATGIYTQVLPNVEGCDSTITLNLTVSTIDGFIQVNGPVLTANANNATYQWGDCSAGFASISGASAQVYTANSNGNYAVVISNGVCTTTSVCIPVIVLSSESGHDKLNKAEMVYPNPSNGIFTISCADIRNVKVLNALGEQIQLMQSVNSKLVELNLTERPNGIYVVQIFSEKSVKQFSIVKE